MRRWIFVLSLAALGCGDSDSSKDTGATDETAGDGGDVTGDVGGDADLTGKSVYHLEFTFNDTPFVVDRDLSGLDQYFAFGSTHIAPAVSFGMTDSIQFPRTMTIGINFGIVIPSGDHPIQTEGAGSHPFIDEPPSVELFIGGLQYRSTLEGASGAVNITEWGTATGDTVAGTFEGTLMSEGTTGRTLDVSGSFHFTLPERHDGQPQ